MWSSVEWVKELVLFFFLNLGFKDFFFETPNFIPPPPYNTQEMLLGGLQMTEHYGMSTDKSNMTCLIYLHKFVCDNALVKVILYSFFF